VHKVSNFCFDGYEWEQGVHCRVLRDAGRTEKTPARDADGLWVMIIIDGEATVTWEVRSPNVMIPAWP